VCGGEVEDARFACGREQPFERRQVDLAERGHRELDLVDRVGERHGQQLSLARA
jgi:hypothetical protein